MPKPVPGLRERFYKSKMEYLFFHVSRVNVHEHIAHTRLHKVYVVYRGVEMVVCEELT